LGQANKEKRGQVDYVYPFKQLKKKGDMWVLHPLHPKYEDIEEDNR